MPSRKLEDLVPAMQLRALRFAEAMAEAGGHPLIILLNLLWLPIDKP